jgi:hypothetical protein
MGSKPLNRLEAQDEKASGLPALTFVNRNRGLTHREMGVAAVPESDRSTQWR